MAFQELFRLWDIPYKTKKSVTPCRQAKSKGLGCLDARSSMNALLHLNRPAVLKLFDSEGKEFYATLTALQGQTATFVVGNETRKVDVKEIELRWLGDYTVFWRMPPKYQGDIRP